MKNIIGFVLIGVWIYIYYLMHKAQLKAWKYFWTFYHHDGMGKTYHDPATGRSSCCSGWCFW